MPIVSRAVCVQCNSTFTLHEEQMRLLPTMRVKRKKRNADQMLHTWADWVEHVCTHCPNCRMERPPIDCVDDLTIHAQAYAQNHSELEAKLNADNDRDV